MEKIRKGVLGGRLEMSGSFTVCFQVCVRHSILQCRVPYWLLVAASVMSFRFTADLLSAWNSADRMPSERKATCWNG